MKTEETFVKEISALINVPLKTDQLDALKMIYAFLFQGDRRSIFLLKGYAGTGKTTLIGGLIRWFHQVNRKTVLMAPTGRSAKVLASHSGYPASTIHRRIYSVKENDQGRPFMDLVRNTSEKTMFFVDEASMIGERNAEDGYNARSLLEDLINYVQSGERCRLIFIGDEAQLPPVGMDLSPAMDPEHLRTYTHAPVYESQLTEVVRQAAESMVLRNATRLREKLSDEDFSPPEFEVSVHEDMNTVEPYDLEDKLSQSFSGERAHESVIICRSNKDAYQFNAQIRNRILFREQELEAGDRVMVVKNNYKQKLPGKRQNFLANGDMVTVERVHAVTTFGEFKFAEVQAFFSDEPDLTFDLILLMNSLDYNGPSIPSKELLQLRDAMIQSGALDPGESREKFFQNPYLNAVQVKYAYAITCHKSQGGQWKNVFLYQGYIPEDGVNRAYYRWLYTALTRATDQLYLVQFPEEWVSVV